MFTATMPLAAQCLPIAFIVTTVYEILWTELRKKGCSLPLWKRSIFSDVDGRRAGMCLFHFGGQTRALPSMWRSLVLSPLPISTTPSIARLTLRSRNTLIMMKASKVLALSSRRWSSKLQVAQMRKDSKCYASCFVSQPSINVQLSMYCGRAGARLACNIQSSVSQCFLNRAGSLAAVEKEIDFITLF